MEWTLEITGTDSDGDTIEIWRCGHWWHHKNLSRRTGEWMYVPSRDELEALDVALSIHDFEGDEREGRLL